MKYAWNLKILYNVRINIKAKEYKVYGIYFSFSNCVSKSINLHKYSRKKYLSARKLDAEAKLENKEEITKNVATAIDTRLKTGPEMNSKESLIERVNGILSSVFHQRVSRAALINCDGLEIQMTMPRAAAWSRRK